MNWKRLSKDFEYCEFEFYGFGDYMIEYCESFIEEKSFVLFFSPQRKDYKTLGHFPDSESAKQFAKNHHRNYVGEILKECSKYHKLLQKSSNKENTI